MTNEMQTILMENANKIAKESSESVNSDGVVEEGKDAKPETKEKEAEKQEVETEEKKPSIKPKKDWSQQRVDAITAQWKTDKEQSDKKIAELEKQIAAMQNKKEPEEDELVLDTVEDLADALKGMVSKKELESAIDKLVTEKLKIAGEQYQKQTREQSLKSMQNDFYGIMNKYFNPENDSEFLFGDEKDASDAQLISELFESKPEFYLKMAKDKGLAYLRKFVTGELEQEQKVDKLKSIINKADAVSTNISSGTDVKSINEEKPAKTMRDVFANAMKKINKGV